MWNQAGNSSVGVVRVLLVDDDESQRELTKYTLEKADPSQKITAVLRPSNALRTLSKQQFDCIVSDYQMPEMNGIQFCAEVRKKSNIPFIIYTGRGSEEVASQAFAAGVDDYVRKETDLAHYQVLVRRIRHAVERHLTYEMYRVGIEGNRDGISIIQGTDFVYANQAMAGLLGVGSAAELIDQSITRWLTGDDKESVVRRTLSRQSGGIEPEVFHYSVKRADGNVVILHASASVISFKGRPASIVFNHDDTERVALETKLIDSRIDLKRAQAVARMGSWRLDTRTNILLWSDETYRIFNVPPNTPLTYELFLSYVHPEDRSAVDENWQAALGGKPYEIEHRIIVDGEVRWVREKAELEFDPGHRLQGGFGTVQDISEQKKTEELIQISNKELQRKNEELQETEKKLKRYSAALESNVVARTMEITEAGDRLEAAALYTRSLIEASLDPLVTINADGKITDVNEATIHATGVERDCLIGSEFVDYFTEPEMAREGLMRAFAEGYVRDYPLAIRHASGMITEVQYNAVVYRDTSGEVAGIFAAARDVTEKNRMAKKLLQAESMEAVGKLTAMLAHDLQNPLNFISQASELARKEPERADRLLQLIGENASRSLKMIEELRAGTKEISLQRVDTDLTQLIEKLSEETRAPEGVKIELAMGKGVGVVHIDAGLMRRVLDNLVANAVEAMPDGGEVTIRTSTGNGVISIDVEDTGTGIPPDVAARLFGPFYSTKPKGLGLGLPFCKRAVEAHRGTLTFTSQKGVGTTFTVTLPTS
ncbi:MAG: PAS domain S-box protein [Candidatus Bathyarchaeota archaeon]|nr:PAS domain S-box protein [Candidatus Bathyarchaeota archaeon]